MPLTSQAELHDVVGAGRDGAPFTRVHCAQPLNTNP